MTKLYVLDPNEGNENKESSPKRPVVKFDEDKLCKAFLNKFYTMGIMTEAEHGTVIAVIGNGKRSQLQ